MKTLIGIILTIRLFVGAALALDNQYQTKFITSATLTIHVKEGQYLTIRNFTQDNAESGQRGIVVVTLNPSTSTPTPTAVPTATPLSLTTTAGPGVSLSSFDSLNDTATLAGGNNPTGTITFNLRDPNNSVVDMETVVVNGDGDYKTQNGYNPAFSSGPTGTYTWSAHYSGDVNNASADDNGQNETAVVTDTPTPAPSATPTPTPTPTATPAPTPVTGAVLTATVLNPIANPLPTPTPPSTPKPTGESIKPFLIAGPALLTIDPVPGATLAITYRKYLQRIQPTPTASASSATSTTVSGSTFTNSKSSGSRTTSSRTTTVLQSTVTDDDDDLSSPTPTPVSTSTPRPTPTPVPKSTPTPTPSAIPTPAPSATPTP